MTLRQIFEPRARTQRASWERNGGKMQCPECFAWHHVLDLYRCLYCDLWFCETCAGEHFGATVDEHEAQRAEPAPAV